MKKKLLTLLFEKANDSNLNTPKTAQGIMMSSGIADVIDTMFCLVNNFKLFEDGVLDFEKIMYKVADLL